MHLISLLKDVRRHPKIIRIMVNDGVPSTIIASLAPEMVRLSWPQLSSNLRIQADLLPETASARAIGNPCRSAHAAPTRFHGPRGPAASWSRPASHRANSLQHRSRGAESFV